MLSNYCGPGGKGRTRHATDKACKRHDAAYARMAEKKGLLYAYTHFGKADEKFLKDLGKIKSRTLREWVIKKLSQTYMKGKGLVAPRDSDEEDEPRLINRRKPRPPPMAPPVTPEKRGSTSGGVRPAKKPRYDESMGGNPITPSKGSGDPVKLTLENQAGMVRDRFAMFKRRRGKSHRPGRRPKGPKGHKKAKIRRIKKKSHRRKTGKLVHARFAMFDDWSQYNVGTMTGLSNNRGYVDMYFMPNQPITQSGFVYAGRMAAPSILQDFQKGEVDDATPLSGRVVQGLFDAPFLPGRDKVTGNQVSTYQPVDLNEVLHIDEMKVDIFYTNTANVSVVVEFEEYVCVSNSSLYLKDIVDAAYGGEQFFTTSNASGTYVNHAITAVAPPTVLPIQNELSFDSSKVPGIGKYWRKKKTSIKMIRPGAEEKITFKWKNVKWNGQLYSKIPISGGNLPIMLKGITRCVRIATRGTLGISPTTGGGGFMLSQVAYAVHRFVKGHRAVQNAQQKKQWLATNLYVNNLNPDLNNYVAPVDAEEGPFFTAAGVPIKLIAPDKAV